jgi:hypothetical protein
VVLGAGHCWSVDPIEEPGSFGAYAGPRLLRFLETALSCAREERRFED